MSWRDSPISKRSQKRLFVLQPQLLRQGIDVTSFSQGRIIQSVAMEVAFEDFSSQCHASFALLRFQPIADFGFSAGGLNQLQPITGRDLLWCRDNLNGITAAQYVFQCDQLPINPRARAVIADVGMNPVREIDNR